MQNNAFEVVDFPYTTDAEPLFERVRSLENPVWLDSGKPRSLQGRFDIISAAPLKVLETCGSITSIIEDNATSVSHEDPFTLSEALWQELEAAPDEFNNQPFTGGIIGFWGYDLGRRIENIPDKNPSVCSIPDMRMGQYVWALVLNHSAQKAWLFFHPACPPSLKKSVSQCLNSTAPEPDHNFELCSPFRESSSKQQHAEAVTKIQHYIHAGDCYQVNLATHFSATFKGDSWQAYKQLRRALPSPYSAYIEWNDKAVLSLSPERFLKSSMNQVETKPIKGTVKRGTTLEIDNQNAIELMNCKKNRAENLMIVDLLRNDLGKSCDPGSIRVPKLFALESFANVHHLVSTVTAKLSDGETPLSLLRGCFPGGSITGAPKKRAMEIIDELENCRRNLYCGSIGYVSTTGRMDTNIAIRTMLADGHTLNCWGGRHSGRLQPR